MPTHTFYIVPRMLFIKVAPRYWDEPEAFKVLIDHSLLAVHQAYTATPKSTAWKKIIQGLEQRLEC